METFNQFIERKKQQYGEKFDSSELNKEFIPYFENQKRIAVDFGYKVKRGTIVSNLIDSTDKKIQNSISELSLIQSRYLYDKYLHLLESEKKRKQQKFEKIFVLTVITLNILIGIPVLIF